VTALKYHTHDGKTYQAGDTYQAEESLVASLVAQGMAAPAAKATPPTPKPSQPVGPMTTADLGIKPPQK
jgi:hypothetical protein